jgi:hypothetical protein
MRQLSENETFVVANETLASSGQWALGPSSENGQNLAMHFDADFRVVEDLAVAVPNAAPRVRVVGRRHHAFRAFVVVGLRSTL